MHTYLNEIVLERYHLFFIYFLIAYSIRSIVNRDTCILDSSFAFLDICHSWEILRFQFHYLIQFLMNVAPYLAVFNNYIMFTLRVLSSSRQCCIDLLSVPNIIYKIYDFFNKKYIGYIGALLPILIIRPQLVLSRSCFVIFPYFLIFTIRHYYVSKYFYSYEPQQQAGSGP